MYCSTEPLHIFHVRSRACVRRWLHSLVVTGCVLYFPRVFAQVETVGLSTGYAVKTILSLVLVLLAICALIYALKRLQGFSASSHADMKILSSMPVGPREKIMLVRVGEEQLLLGVTNASVQLIKVLDKPLYIAGENAGENTGEGGSGQGFSTHLDKLLNR